MKNLCMIIAMMLAGQAAAQNADPTPLSVDSSTGKYTTSGVVTVDNKSKQLLLEGAYNWLSVIKFGNSLGSKGIVMDEAVFGRIIVNQYYISSAATFNSKVRYTLVLEFKDDKYRYHFTDLYYLAVTKRKNFEEAETSDDKMLIGKFLLETNTYVKNFIYELTTYLNGYNVDNRW